MRIAIVLAELVALTMVTIAAADITVPGADGSDGVFDPTGATFTVDLTKAVTGVWDDPSGDADEDGFGDGIYDPEKFAVVFKYSSVDIPAGTTVKFINHSSRAPVVWLVSGAATIAGSVDISGANGHPEDDVPIPSEPGPGGFRGGVGHYGAASDDSGGYGPGGARILDSLGFNSSFGGSYSMVSTGGTGGSPGPAYGNANLIPLIGGSGGGGYMRNASDGASLDGGAGAGGGAILIAVVSDLTVSGSMLANGGDHTFPGSGGSGGAVRLVADTISGSGILRAVGGSGYTSGGAVGRLRVEANDVSLPDPGSPPISIQQGGITSATLWPAPEAPSIRILSVGPEAVPGDPHGNFAAPDVQISMTGATTIIVEAHNMPLDWIVTVRATKLYGQDIVTTATFSEGDESLSYWTASMTLPNGHAALQVRAAKP